VDDISPVVKQMVVPTGPLMQADVPKTVPQQPLTTRTLDSAVVVDPSDIKSTFTALGNSSAFSGFNLSMKPAQSTFAGFGLKSDSTSTATSALFSGFGPPLTSATPISGSFSNEPPKTDPSPALTGFTIPSFSAPPSAATFPGIPNFSAAFSATPAKSDGADEEEDDEPEPIMEPEKVERNPDDKDEILHDVDCKLFRFAKETNEWKDVGRGSFKVTRDPDSGKTRILVRNTLGKITLNAAFYKGINFKKTGKAGIQFAAVTGDNMQLQSLLVKVKPADLDETFKQLCSQIPS
jgi:hypothetical protein